MEAPELSFIIPALNESAIILNNVDEVAAWVQANLPSSSFEVIVVDDGSSDGMGAILEEAATSRPWLSVAYHKKNFGRGRGVRTGFKHSRGQYIFCLDADLSYAPSIIPDLLGPLKNGDADITLASAHHPQGDIVNVPGQRAMLSKWGNALLGKGFSEKYHTVTCIVRGFTREVVDSLELVNDGKELHLEIIQKAQMLGYRVLEVPAVLAWRDKKRGVTKRKSLLPEIAILKMRRTVLSHLIFNYITNPGILLFIPILTLLGIIVATGSMLLLSFIDKLTNIDTSLFQVIRTTILDGQLSFLVLLFSFITLMIFLIFYFLSNQNKRYFEETYTLIMRMNSRIKELEKGKE